MRPTLSRASTPASWSSAFFFFLKSSQCNRRPSGPVPLCRPTLPSRSPRLPWLWLPPSRPCGPPSQPTAPVLWSPPSWPTFGRARHPAGPAPLFHPKRCPLSCSAGYPGSEQPCSAFRASPPQRVRRRRRRPLATHLDIRYGEDGARPLVSNVSSLKQRRTARNRAQAHNINISCRAMATAYHIASRDGDGDNNTAVTTSYVVNKQPLVRMRTSFILQKQCARAHELLTHCVAHRRRQQDLVCKRTQHVASHGGDGDQASCASAQQHVASHGGDGDKASCASARQHVASHGGNGDKARGNEDDEVVGKASHSRRVARRRQRQQLRQ